ncbi:hypothetical protein EDC30_10993 [Paucimonas lemoignei]|uniref:Uncharacterized protein n=1 Tax=Paucimonas lemoignei TaxID=29443 RepID=A0A4R3HSY7_PAULE|nr:hypothetical protein [Paucimonas lemoignei]TCS35794.1 hypothetical protein EDC30_10993 [Paucimonas lemoignei]
MNPLSPEQVILTSFKDAIAGAYPSRIATRSLKDFAERDHTELKAGIYTVIADGRPEGDVYFQSMNFIVVGQIQLGEKAEGEEVENAELEMAREITNLIQRKFTGPDMKITKVDQSAQLEVPYGWISMHIRVGPYDATEPLTADEVLGNLTDFLTVRADVDIAPHESAAEHQKWAQDTPDYSTSQPDAQLRVNLQE